MTVRIRPTLNAQLVGAGVAGAPLRLAATLAPAQAGRVRVQVIRGGSSASTGASPAARRSRSARARPGRSRVRLTTVPAARLGVGRPGALGDAPPAEPLRRDDRPGGLAAREASSPRCTTPIPSFSSTFSYDFVESVWAFQKVQGLDRTGAVDARFWARLDNPRIPQPRYSEPADHIEVDKTRQVLYLVRGGKITLISPVATAGIAGYYTPEGRFAIYEKVTGWDTSPLGVLWNPMYFVGGYAIHGGDPVPPYPASHGCVRVPDFVIAGSSALSRTAKSVYVY